MKTLISYERFISENERDLHERHMNAVLDAYADETVGHPFKIALDNVVAKRNPGGLTREQLKMEREAFKALHEVLLSESRNRVDYATLSCRMS